MGFLIPFLCALALWLCAVWFLDLAILCSGRRGWTGAFRIGSEAHHVSQGGPLSRAPSRAGGRFFHEHSLVKAGAHPHLPESVCYSCWRGRTPWPARPLWAGLAEPRRPFRKGRMSMLVLTLPACIVLMQNIASQRGCWPLRTNAINSNNLSDTFALIILFRPAHRYCSRRVHPEYEPTSNPTRLASEPRYFASDGHHDAGEW